MAQPVSAAQWKRLSGTAAGTTVISETPATLCTVTAGGNYTGTITFYDASTAGGSSATNLMLAINNNSGSVPVTIDPYVSTRNGIVAVLGGTTDVLVGWDK